MTINWNFHNGATYQYHFAYECKLTEDDVHTVTLQYITLTNILPNKLYITPIAFSSLLSHLKPISVYSLEQQRMLQFLSSPAGMLEIHVEPNLKVPFLIGRLEDAYLYLDRLVTKEFENIVLHSEKES